MQWKNVHINYTKLKKISDFCKSRLCAYSILLSFVMFYIFLYLYLSVPCSRNVVKLMNVDKRHLSKVREKNGLSTSINKTFEVKLKPGLMELINPTEPKYALVVNSSYHLENKEFCSKEKYLTILVLVLSTTYNFQRRKDVRETWGNSSHYQNFGTVKVMFLLGLTQNVSVQQQIDEEFENYQDILQGSFIDSYRNVSFKSIIAFKWLIERCRNAQYVIKTDDDVVINIFRIFGNDIPQLSIDRYHVHCQRRYSTKIARKMTAKARVEPQQFRGLKKHMPYCHGQYVMFLNDIVPYLYQSIAITPFFWIDDVFNYGIVMNNIPGLKYKQVHPSEFISYLEMKHPIYRLLSSPVCRYIYIVADDENDIGTIWQSLRTRYSRIN